MRQMEDAGRQEAEKEAAARRAIVTAPRKLRMCGVRVKTQRFPAAD